MLSELRSCVKVEVAVLGFPSLTVLVVSVDVKHHRLYTPATTGRLSLCSIDIRPYRCSFPATLKHDDRHSDNGDDKHARDDSNDNDDGSREEAAIRFVRIVATVVVTVTFQR